MRDRTIYIVVTRTNTIPSRAIRIYTGCPYNHVSLSIDSRLEDMVSFGRLYPSMPMPGGFVHEGKNKGFFRHFRDTHCRVYSKTIGEWEYQKFLHLLHKIENRSCKFNHLGAAHIDCRNPLGTEKRLFLLPVLRKNAERKRYPSFS